MAYLPADYTHVLPVPCTPSEQFMPLLQGHCSPGKLWQEKGGLGDFYIYIYIHTLLETQPITSREYISLEKPVFSIGLMPLLLENAHATALLSRVMNLVKEAVEHLNPNQTPVLTMDQPLSAIAKEIQWLWSDSFSNNKYVIMTRGWVWVGVGSSRWDGLECGWMVLGWPSAITTAGTELQNLLWKHLILRGQDMPTSLQL